MNASAISISNAADTASGDAPLTLTVSGLTLSGTLPLTSPPPPLSALLVLTRLDGDVVPFESLPYAHAAELVARADFAVPVDVVPALVVPLHSASQTNDHTSPTKCRIIRQRQVHLHALRANMPKEKPEPQPRRHSGVIG